MKIKTALQTVCAGLAFAALNFSVAQAGDVLKADNTNSLNLGAAWVGNVAPGAGDVAVWDNTVQTNLAATPGGALNWAGIKVLDPAGLITIAADGNSLTNGASGIDLSQATNGLTINSPLVLDAGQTWNVTNGQTLTLGGAVSGTGAPTIAGGGTVVLAVANTFSAGTTVTGAVVEARSGSSFGSGSVNINDGSTLRVRTTSTIGSDLNFSGTDIVDLGNTGGNTALDGAWSGSGNITVINMDGSALRTFTIGGNNGNMSGFTGSLSLGTNTGYFRFNDGGSSANTGSDNASFDLGTGGAIFFTRNRNASVHFGALTGGPNTTIQHGTSSSGTSTYTVGALNTSTTYSGTIKDGGSSAAVALTKVGTGTLTLTGTNSNVGKTTVSAGVLQIGDGGTAGQLGSGAVVNNATLAFNRADDISVANAFSGTGTTIKNNANTLTYAGTNTSSGALVINAGTVALGAAGSISSPITVAAGATFDISQNPSFSLASTLAGNGTVNGALTASGGVISPGGADAAGALTFATGLTEQGSVINRFELSAPGGTNDQISVVGDLNLSGVNPLIVGPFFHGAIATGTYTLMTYTGNLIGDLSNFQVSISGGFGTLTNPPGVIALIVTPPPRGATNLVWTGDGGANAWDYFTSTNWENGGVPFKFLNGDSVTFNDVGATNPNVNLTDAVLPAAVTVDAASDYTFSGDGEIGGATGLVKTNSGTLTLNVTNNYTGPTILGGGTLAVVDLENGASPSSIGSASSDPTNLVFNGGSLSYLGTSGATDRGATLNGAGGNIAVAGGGSLTLNGGLVGGGALIASGAGTLTIGVANAYTGGTVISNGVLALGNNTANSSGLGSGPVTFAGGTLQLFGYNGSTSPSYNQFNNDMIVPAGQTGTLQLYPRSAGVYGDLTGSGTLNLVVNYVRDDLVGDWSAFAGVINVTPKSSSSVSEFRIHNTHGYGNATINLNDGVLMDVASPSGATITIGALAGTGLAVIGKGNSSAANPNWSVGWNNADSTYSGAIQDDGTSDFIKVGTGTLTLDSSAVITNVTTPDGFTFVTNVSYQDSITYSGSTTISDGTLKLVVPAALTNSPAITLGAPTAVLDATDMGYISNIVTLTSTNQILITNGVFEVIAGQTVAGVGTILASNLVADSGSTLNVGLPTGGLAVSGDAGLFGAVSMNLDVTNAANCSQLTAASFTVDPGASLVVNNVGPEAGATFQLFSQPVNFTTVTLPALTGTNQWVNNLAVNGSLTLLAPPLSVVNPNPTNIVATFNAGAGTLTLQWPADHTGWTLQVQTNSIAAGLGTNWVDVAGSAQTNQVVMPVDPQAGAVFYRMTYQP